MITGRGDVEHEGHAMTKQKRELFDLAAKVLHETDRAWLLFDGTTKAWVPKSVVENNGDGTFTMPSEMAEEKGFV